MSTFSRRDFLGAGGALAGLVLLQQDSGLAARGCDITRYNLASHEGRRMMRIYADGVRRMNNPVRYRDSNPRSWLFQWYTHMVRGDRTKAAELGRLYPRGGRDMALADEVWNTCQAHLGQPQQYFLPWHRMYVFFFEQVIREVTNEPCFTLPYWDYTDPAQQALPEEFRQRNHARWGALYYENRYGEINAGTPLPRGPAGLRLDLECMKSGSYNAFNGDAGFCANLDGLVHGAAHLDIGTQLGMGAVPWAAADPVFWVHHCNVDRIWASWNRLGGSNPADAGFLDKTFVFADGDGDRSEARVGDVVSLPAPAYDAYLARPAGSLPFQSGSGGYEERNPSALLETNDAGLDGAIALGGEPATVSLSAGLGRGPAPFASGAPWKRPGAQVILAIEGRTAARFVPTAYDIYLHGGGGALRAGSPAHVGQLHFFGLEMEHEHMQDMHRHGDSGPAGRDVSFVLRSDTRAHLARLDPNELAVTFVPIRAVEGPSGAALRHVALFVR